MQRSRCALRRPFGHILKVAPSDFSQVMRLFLCMHRVLSPVLAAFRAALCKVASQNICCEINVCGAKKDPNDPWSCNLGRTTSDVLCCFLINVSGENKFKIPNRCPVWGWSSGLCPCLFLDCRHGCPWVRCWQDDSLQNCCFRRKANQVVGRAQFGNNILGHPDYVPCECTFCNISLYQAVS
eukprot:SAG22_NODE_3012_length_2028_cov_1.546397_2_plen_182_part_00